jgi:hypothetical protein
MIAMLLCSMTLSDWIQMINHRIDDWMTCRQTVSRVCTQPAVTNILGTFK